MWKAKIFLINKAKHECGKLFLMCISFNTIHSFHIDQSFPHIFVEKCEIPGKDSFFTDLSTFSLHFTGSFQPFGEDFSEHPQSHKLFHSCQTLKKINFVPILSGAAGFPSQIPFPYYYYYLYYIFYSFFICRKNNFSLHLLQEEKQSPAESLY